MRKNSRKSSRALTSCRRGDLPEGSPVGGRPRPELLRELSRLDRDLELYWNPLRRRWSLYRVKARGVTKPADMLVKELELNGPRGEYRPPGQWLVDWLRVNDKTRGGSMDQAAANRAYLRSLSENEDRLEHEKGARRTDMAEDYAKNVCTYVFNRKKHFAQGLNR